MTEREIFEAALDIEDLEQRAAFISTACRNAPHLGERIRSLLESRAGEKGFLDKPVFDEGILWLEELIGSSPDGTGRQHAAGDLPNLSFLEPPSLPEAIGSLGHYQVLEILGHGHFGIVLKAFDEALHRTVAVKVLKPELTTTSPPRKRFLREARSAALVQHENVVRVHSVEEHPLPYLVMEHVEGQTLQSRLDDTGPLDLCEILELGRQIAAGLAAAHEHGLVHRDIKPANILLERLDGARLNVSGHDVAVGHSSPGAKTQWQVKITDFGLARATDDASLTHSGMIVGTPLFMSPEQARGEPLDHRSDLFSLGSVLYAMTTGRPPFRAENTLAVLKRVSECKPRSILEVIPETPVWLVAIIDRLHAENPDDRFASARELAELLGYCQAAVASNTEVRLPQSVILAGTDSTAAYRSAASTPPSAPAGNLVTSRLRVRLALGAAGIVLALGVAEALDFVNFIPVPTSTQPIALVPPISGNEFDARTSSPDLSVSVGNGDQKSRQAIRFSAALQFNGVDAWVALPIRDDRPAPFTVEAWVKPAQTGRLATIIAAFRAPRGMGMSIFEDQFEAAVSYLDAAVWSTAKSRRRPDADSWQHVAAVVTPSQIELFLNGRSVATCVIEGEHLPSGSPFCVGGFEGFDLFKGLIAEVRISRVARYANDFQPQHRMQPDDETLGLYHCDELQGDLLPDSSAHSHHGSVHNAELIRLD